MWLLLVFAALLVIMFVATPAKPRATRLSPRARHVAHVCPLYQWSWVSEIDSPRDEGFCPQCMEGHDPGFIVER